MLKVGLTGGIAVGKSVVGEMFATLGAHVIQADEISHQLMQPGEPVYRRGGASFRLGDFEPRWQREPLPAGGERFRFVLRAGHRERSSRIAELNQIVHPAVIVRQQEWMQAVAEREPHGIAIVEAALILEANMAKSLDRLVVVTCKPEQRIERLARRLKLDEQTARREVERRMAAQLTDDEKIKAADYVIDNSGSLDETRRQVEDVFGKLKREAES